MGDAQVPLQQTGVDATPSLDVKDAVRIAMEYFRELFGNPFVDLSLEEVQKGAHGQWVVVHPAKLDTRGRV